MDPCRPKWPALLFAAALACGGGDIAPGDAGFDAGAPSAADAGDETGTRNDAGPPDHGDAGADAGSEAADAGHDAGTQPECQWGGAPGTCLAAAACTSTADHSAETSASCASGLSCCIDTPDVRDNPPIPAGYKLMTQAQVTPAMTTWAVAILHDPVTFPMYSTTTKTFGALHVLARVEWHPPDFQNGIVHRGVTLYVPI